MVDVADLERWCAERGRRATAASRSAYAAEMLRQRHTDAPPVEEHEDE
jgi:hypothetical protein